MTGISILSCKKSTIVPAPSSASAMLQGGVFGKVPPPPKQINTKPANQGGKKNNQRPPLPKHLQEKRESLERKQDEISTLRTTFTRLFFANEKNANEIDKIEKLLAQIKPQQAELAEAAKNELFINDLKTELAELKAAMKKNERKLLSIEQDLADVSKEHAINKRKYISEVEKYYNEVQKQNIIEEQ